MSITRRGLHEEISRLDGEIAARNEAKAAAFGAYRDQLADTGHGKSAIKSEIDAFKKAERKLRALQQDADVVMAQEELVDEIVAELMRPAVGTDVARAPMPPPAGRTPPVLTGARRAREAGKLRSENFQEPRLAPLSEMKAAWCAGNPIGTDTTYRDAHVYFAAFDNINRLKIGVSNDVAQRLDDLVAGCGCECWLIGTIPGNRQDELRALESFGDVRIQGEWFKYDAEILKRVTLYIASEQDRLSAAPRARRARVKEITPPPSIHADLAAKTSHEEITETAQAGPSNTANGGEPAPNPPVPHHPGAGSTSKDVAVPAPPAVTSPAPVVDDEENIPAFLRRAPGGGFEGARA